MGEQKKPMVPPLTLFYSYAHEDELLRNELEKHLSLLHRQGFISEWHDRQILAGDEWAQVIDEHLERASIILLLVSADFLASDYCYAIEMQRALERRKRGEARVIPIILRPCDWRNSPFATQQCLPRDGKAVTTWQDKDEAFLAIAQGLRRTIEQERIPRPPLPEVERKNRKALIKRVQTTWIEGLLDQSLHEAARLELHLQERPDALVNPWRLQVQELNRPPQSLPAGTSIAQVYDGADGELLILGEPGAGKTTLLLELARALLDRAEADEHHRIPVVFQLSSWAEKRLPLSEWLVEELWTKYQVPHKIGQSWMVSGQLLPLLDGLDEVAEGARPGCVQEINAYYQQYLEGELVPMAMVVCCRSNEYMALPTRVNLHQAVSIQPLTDEQIDHYLRSTEGQLETLEHALHTDSELYELAHRPLMLSIFTLAYQKAAPEDLPTEGTRQTKPQQVFATYVKRMFSRREVLKGIPLQQALCWLTFVASQMQKHHQTAFYLENLQPNWLTDRRTSQRYDRLAVQLPGALMGVLAILVPNAVLLYKNFFNPFFAEAILLSGLLGWLLSGGGSVQQDPGENRGKTRDVHWPQPLQQLGLAVLLGLIVGVSFWLGLDFDWKRGLFTGLGFGICCILLIALLKKRNTAKVPEMPSPLGGTESQHFVRRMAIRNGLLVGLLIGVSNALSVPPLGAELSKRLLIGLIAALFGGLTGGFLSVLLIERDAGVKPTDRLIWSGSSLAGRLFSKRHVGLALLVAVLIGLLTSFCIWLIRLINDKRSELNSELLIFGLLFGLIFGLGYWLLFGFFWGIPSRTIEDEHRMIPNQGIRNSALNGLVFGLVIAMVVGVSGGLAFGWGGGLMQIVFTGLIIGLSVGLLLGLLKGGLACLRHCILRVLLWHSGAIPWNYTGFLDAAAARILLRKVGGGYIFLHSLLLDYFAALETGPPCDELAEHRNEAAP